MNITDPIDAAGRRMAGTLIVMLAFFLIAAGAWAQERNPDAKRTSGGRTAADDTRRFVSIDFNNVDISVFIKFISELTAKTSSSTSGSRAR